MAPSTILTGTFDDLPDEIVQKILDYAMEREEVFFVDYCRERGTRSDTSLGVIPGVRIVHGEDASEHDTFTIYYPHCKQSSRIRVDRTRMQTYHLADWVRMNTTSSRIRRLGKESFFRCKIYVLARDIPGKLQERTYRMWSSEDQAMALDRIHHVISYDDGARTASAFLSIPKRLAGFARLEYFTLTFGSRMRDPLDEVRAAMQPPPGPQPMPRKLLDALVGIGLRTDGIKCQIIVAPGEKWAAYEEQLERNVYPMLEVKAQILAKRKARELEEQNPPKRQHT